MMAAGLVVLTLGSVTIGVLGAYLAERVGQAVALAATVLGIAAVASASVLLITAGTT